MSLNKSILLLIAVLTGMALSSCQDEPTPEPDAGTAQVQIFYMPPLKGANDNSIYRMTVGDEEFTNADNSQPLINLSNGYTINKTKPDSILSIPAGTNNITLYNKAGEKVYEHSITLDRGQAYQITITQPDKAPIIADAIKLPEFTPVDEKDHEIGYYAICFSNFLYEDVKTPTTEKLQLKLLNRTTNEYEPVGQPVAFGQTTECSVHQYPYNVYDGLRGSSGFIKVVIIGSDGNESELTYRMNGEMQPSFTDRWTLMLGLGHKWTITGVRDNDNIPVKATQWLFK